MNRLRPLLLPLVAAFGTIVCTACAPTRVVTVTPAAPSTSAVSAAPATSAPANSAGPTTKAASATPTTPSAKTATATTPSAKTGTSTKAAAPTSSGAGAGDEIGHRLQFPLIPSSLTPYTTKTVTQIKVPATLAGWTQQDSEGYEGTLYTRDGKRMTVMNAGAKSTMTLGPQGLAFHKFGCGQITAEPEKTACAARVPDGMMVAFSTDVDEATVVEFMRAFIEATK